MYIALASGGGWGGLGPPPPPLFSHCADRGEMLRQGSFSKCPPENEKIGENSNIYI